MKKIIFIILLSGLGLAWFGYRSQQPAAVRDQIKVGNSMLNALQIIQDGIISPYACIWEGAKPTRHCEIPNDVVNDVASSVLVVYKGIGINSNFKISYGKSFNVTEVGELTSTD